MGWKSDSLYRLVFEQFEQAWSRAQQEGETRFGPAPTSIVVAQYDQALADGTPPYCKGTAVRAWKYSGIDWTGAESIARGTEDNSVHGMFYQTAIGRFYISNDRKTVIIEYIFGPRYGRGFAFVAEGQGNSARLLPKPGSVIWHP